MTHRIDGAGAGNANYVQQQNNNVIQDQNNNPELGQARKSGSKLGLAVKIVATILTGGLFGIGWGIYSLVHRASKSQNTSPLNQNNTGVPGEKPINKGIIDKKEEAEIDNYKFKEPEDGSALKFTTGIDKNSIKGIIDENFEYSEKWQKIPEDLTELDKKDCFLEGGLKGTSVEKPVRKMINGFFNFVGRETVNKLIKNMFTWEENRRIDVEKLSDNARKALLMTAILRADKENCKHNFSLENFNDLRKQKGLLISMEYSLNTMLHEVDDKMRELDKKELLSNLNNEIGFSEEEEENQEIKVDEDNNNQVNIEDENQEEIEEENNQQEIGEKNTQNRTSNNGIFDSSGSIQAHFIDKNKYMGFLDVLTQRSTFVAVLSKEVKNYFMNMKNFGQESINEVNKANDIIHTKNTLDFQLRACGIQIYNTVMSKLEYDHAPVRAVLKSHGSSGTPENACFVALLISKAIQNPKNAEFFAEDSDKELRGIEFLKMLNDEVDDLLNEGRNLLNNNPNYA